MNRIVLFICENFATFYQTPKQNLIDKKGLDQIDRRLLKKLIKHHQGGPVGLTTIAASLNEDSGTIEEVIEPYLLQIGFLKRTPKGRVVTEAAYKHLGEKYPEK